MVGPLDVLVRKDLLQGAHDKHFFRLVGTCGVGGGGAAAYHRSFAGLSSAIIIVADRLQLGPFSPAATTCSYLDSGEDATPPQLETWWLESRFRSWLRHHFASFRIAWVALIWACQSPFSMQPVNGSRQSSQAPILIANCTAMLLKREVKPMYEGKTTRDQMTIYCYV